MLGTLLGPLSASEVEISYRRRLLKQLLEELFHEAAAQAAQDVGTFLTPALEARCAPDFQ